MPMVCLHPGASLHCCVYLIHTARAAVMIDAGFGDDEARIVDALHAAGWPPQRIAGCLLTHCHVDHALGAGRWRDAGVPLLASAPTAAIVAAGSRQVWYEHPERVRPIPIDRVVADGETLTFGSLSLRCLATPGHTAGCLSYLLVEGDRRIAFTGDLLMSDGNPGWAGSDDFDADALLVSLRRLLAWRPTLVAHGHAQVADPIPWLEQAIARGEAGQWHLKR